MPDIEDQIQKAIQEGKFDDLSGRGKPLRLDDNPFADPEWRLANHLLKSSGYSLPWIEKRQEIINSLQAAREDLSRAWEWRQSAPQASRPSTQVEAEWQRAINAFKDKLEALNQAILNYNLEAPSDRFQLSLINAEREIAALCADSR